MVGPKMTCECVPSSSRLSTYLLSVEMTRPNVLRLLLIVDASFRRSPVAPEVSARSDPARSIKLILDV